MEDLSKEIDNAVDLLFKLDKQSSKKNKILDKSKTIYLQTALFKTPFIRSRKRKYLKLCHSLYGEDPEICLFVPNKKTGVEYKKTTDELIDFCVDHFTEILEKHKIKGVTTVMPLKQLKSEYGTYELKRKLVHRFDLFLCKNSLLYNPRFITSLGKIFKVANKEPLGIVFPKDDVNFDPEFQKNIERAIYTSSFYINPFSDNYSIPIGNLSNTKKELQENLKTVLDQLRKEKIIPGGLENIRAMYLWPSQSKPVPLYISSELPTSMKKPRLKVKRKRENYSADELSTQPNKKVIVTENGEVFVTHIKKYNSNADKELEALDSEGEDSFADDSDGENDDEKKKTFKSKAKAMVNEEENESESENDEEIEEKEARLLEEKMQAESDSDSNVKSGKSAKKLNKDEKKTKKQRGKNGGIEEDGIEDENVFSPKVKKPGKSYKNKGKINKSKRKLLLKQGKGNAKDRENNEKKKLKEKKK